jgi:hypothetical protein
MATRRSRSGSGEFGGGTVTSPWRLSEEEVVRASRLLAHLVLCHVGQGQRAEVLLRTAAMLGLPDPSGEEACS